MAGAVHVSVLGLERLDSSLSQTRPMLESLVSENASYAKAILKEIDLYLDNYNSRIGNAWQNYQRALAALHSAQRNFDDVPYSFYMNASSTEAVYNKLKNSLNRIKEIRAAFCERNDSLQRTLAEDEETYLSILKKSSEFIGDFINALNRSNSVLNNGGSIGGGGSYSGNAHRQYRGSNSSFIKRSAALFGAGAAAVAGVVAATPKIETMNDRGDANNVSAIYAQTDAPPTLKQIVKQKLPGGYRISNPDAITDLARNIQDMTEAAAEGKKLYDKKDEVGELANALRVSAHSGKSKDA